MIMQKTPAAAAQHIIDWTKHEEVLARELQKWKGHPSP